MPRVILHLGMPRTGSTTLQHGWLRHRAALAELGILYPDLNPPGEASHINHQHLGEAMDASAAGRLDALLAALERALRGGAETVILSYEMWAHRRPGFGGPARLLGLLRGAGAVVEPLAVVRSTPEAANAAYTLRMLFLGEPRDFAAFARSATPRRRLDLAARLLPWMRACGRLLVLPMRDTADPAPLVTRVWRETGIAARAGHLLDAAELSRHENRSAGPVAIEACRWLAATGLRRRQGDEAMRRITREIEAAAARRGADAEPFRGYDPAVAAALASRWAPSNERVARAAWGAPWAARVAPPPPGAVNELARTRDPEGLRLVADVLAEVCPRFGLAVPGAPPAGGLLAGWRRALAFGFRNGGSAGV